MENLAPVRAALKTAWDKVTKDDALGATTSSIERYLGTGSAHVSPADPGVRRVLVVGSLLGGTGAGTFIDVAYLIRDVCGQQGEGILTVPRRDIGLGEVDCRANACAALIELNHFSDPYHVFSPPWDPTNLHTESPFAYTYLLSTRHSPVGGGEDRAGTASTPDLIRMISHYIFLGATSEFSQQVASFMDNFKNVLGEHDDRYNYQRFVTFGLSVIEVPVESIIESCASRLASEALEAMRNGGLPEGQEVVISDATATQTLVRMSLSEEAVADELTAMGGGGGLTSWYTSKVDSMVRGVSSEILLPWASLGRVLRTVRDTQREIDGRLGGDGTAAITGSIQERYPSVRDACLRRLEEELDRIINSERRGTAYATALLQSLQKRFQKIEEAKKAAPAELLGKVDARVKDLAASVAIIQDLVGDWLLFWYRRPILARYVGGRHSRLLKDWCRLRLDQALASFEAQLFRDLRERAELLERRVVSLAQFLGTEVREFATRAEESAQLTTSAMRNLLYTPSDQRRGVVGDVDLWWQKVVSPREQADVLKNYDTVAIRPLITRDGKTDVFLLFDGYSTSEVDREILRDTLLKHARAAFSRVYAESDVAATFFKQYPTHTAQEGAVRTAASGSEPYLILRYGSDGYHHTHADNHRSGLLIRNPDAEDGSRPLLRKALLGALNVPDRAPDAAKNLDEAHFLIVHQHFAGFPIRVIGEMDGLSARYRQVLGSQSKPIHTMPPEFRWERWDKPSPGVIAERKSMFVVARALKALKETTLRSGAVVFEFSYLSQAGGERTKELTGDLRSVADALLDDEIAFRALAERVERKRLDLGDQAVAAALVALEDDLSRRPELAASERKEYTDCLEEYAKSWAGVAEARRKTRETQPLESERCVRVLADRAECPRCDKEVSSGQKFCDGCGWPLIWSPGSHQGE
jgi:hypothetical protein